MMESFLTGTNNIGGPQLVQRFLPISTDGQIVALI